MADVPKPQPELTPRALADRQERLDREAAALRQNLRRRKEQIRARDGVETRDLGMDEGLTSV